MAFCISLSEISKNDINLCGPKAHNLSILAANGFSVPDGLCITTEAYKEYIEKTGLEKKILKELNRKDIESMRWEEIWDTSLRIKTYFINTPIPLYILELIRKSVRKMFKDQYVVVRSSSPEEDSKKTSFAGIHDSFVKIKGIDNIIEHVKLVWSSLFSTAAIIYRNKYPELNKNPVIAVFIQELVESDISGVVFTVNPSDEKTGLIESVWGYNQGLVDGTIEPFRWTIDRDLKKILSFYKPEKALLLKEPSSNEIAELKEYKIPLNNNESISLFKKALNIEKIFSNPEDIEWTKKQKKVFFLQARPITSKIDKKISAEFKKDRELRPDLLKLFILREKIKKEILPGIESDIAIIKKIDILKLDNFYLIKHTAKIINKYLKWKQIYWDYLIPFGHGVRIFGEIYNQKMKPKDPYEYIMVLDTKDIISVNRNNKIRHLAEEARKDREFYSILSGKKNITGSRYLKNIEKILEDLKDDSSFGEDLNIDKILNIIKQYADSKASFIKQDNKIKELKEKFIGKYKERERDYANDLIELARDSYRIRDNDNILMGRVEGLVKKSLLELNKRYKDLKPLEKKDYEDLNNKFFNNSMSSIKIQDKQTNKDSIYARQLTGQPASGGTASGSARVILNKDNLFEIKAGEVIVCDSIDPNMTFIIPAVSAIVERRGGMLIHGAIIAREYKIPCVTGINGATSYIKTGNILHVDGDLGIVIIEKR